MQPWRQARIPEGPGSIRPPAARSAQGSIQGGVVTKSIVRVRVEFKRVQTFLFEVPRLRAMVGANVLLGELLRYELVDLYLALQPQPPDCLAEFAGAAAVSGDSPAAADPLAKALDEYWRKSGPPDLESFDAQWARRYRHMAGTKVDWLIDDPAKAYAHGVLARDGGHYSALFDDENTAREFAAGAVRRAARQTPGVRLEVHLDRWAPEDTKARKNWLALEAAEALSETFLFQLPVFERCPELPNLPADDSAKYWDGDHLATRPMSYPAALRYRYGTRYLRHEPIPESERPTEPAPEQGNASAGTVTEDHEAFHTLDMASLLRPLLPFWESAQRPPDFNAVAGGGYLAVIHMDGNGMGQRSKPLRDEVDRQTTFAGWLKAESGVEALFHQARTLMRSALTDAMSKCFGTEAQWQRKGARLRPYQILMLGGDDLLLVCRADRALPLVLEFARALQSLQAEGCAFPAFKRDPLTVGVGVVIAKPSLPFHRLHALAEGLASSAKGLFRGLDRKSPSSVVDWMVTSNAWAEDAATERAATAVIGQTADRRILMSRRPYRVLKALSEAKQPESSLEELLQAAAQVKKSLRDSQRGAARSQLKALEDDLARGEAMGQLAWLQLPDTTRKALVRAGIGTDSDQGDAVGSPWDAEQTLDGITYLPTRALDVVEIVEIDALAQQTRWSGQVEKQP